MTLPDYLGFGTVYDGVYHTPMGLFFKLECSTAKRCLYRLIRFRTDLVEISPTAIFWHRHCSNCRDVEHGKSAEGRVTYSVVYGMPRGGTALPGATGPPTPTAARPRHAHPISAKGRTAPYAEFGERGASKGAFPCSVCSIPGKGADPGEKAISNLFRGVSLPGFFFVSPGLERVFFRG